MAIVRASFNSAVYGGGALQLAGLACSAGDGLVIGINVISATVTITSLTATGESNGTLLSPYQSGGANNTHHQWGIFKNLSAGTKTIQAVLSGAPTDAMINVWRITGHDLTTMIDGTVQTASGSGTPTLSLTTSAAGSAIFAMGTTDGSSPTPGSGYTEETIPDYNYNFGEYDLDAGTAGSKTVDFGTTGGNWILSAIGILQAGGGGSSIAAISNYYRMLRSS